MTAGSEVIVRYTTQLLVSMPLCQVHLMRTQGNDSTHTISMLPTQTAAPEQEAGCYVSMPELESKQQQVEQVLPSDVF